MHFAIFNRNLQVFLVHLTLIY